MKIFSLETGNEIKRANFTLEYKGYEISATTGFCNDPEICVFPSRESHEVLFSTRDMRANGVKSAMDFIDTL